MRKRSLTLWLSVALTSCGIAVAQTVELVGDGLYLDYDYYIPSLNAPVGVPVLLHVNLLLDGPLPGVTGASFRINGLPSGWVATPTPNPAATTVEGDLFSAGVRIAFADCQTRVGEIPAVNLYTVTLVATSEVQRYVIEVVGIGAPDVWPLPHPTVRLCDDPVFTTINCWGGLLMINPPVAVGGMSWGAVKALYRP